MAVVWLSLLHYYTIYSGFIAYLFIVFRKIKISSTDFFFLFGFILFVGFQIVTKDPSALLTDLRFYWGWVVFYFFFKSKPVDQKIVNTALVMLCVLTFVEAFLINTVIPAQMLPNFPSDTETAYTHFAPVGSYQRPYSFGGNATVASSLLVTLMALCNVQGWRLGISILSVLCFVSGTGMLTLFMLLAVRYRRLIKIVILPTGLIVVLGLLFVNDPDESKFNLFTNKIGLESICLLIDFKISQAAEVFSNYNFYTILVGDPKGFRGGDFGFLDFFSCNGLLGALLFLSLILSRINKINGFPLLIILIASFHYPVMFFLPGQMIFGLLLSINKNGLVVDLTARRKSRVHTPVMDT